MAVVVAGAVANKYLSGGEVWHRLHWLLGLLRLGLDVYFVESIAPEQCVDAHGSPAPFAESANALFFRRTMDQFGVVGRATLMCPRESTTSGLALRDLHSVCDGAVLINISGHIANPATLGNFRTKIYVDEDPGFTQVWAATGSLGTQLCGYDHYLTVGGNIGRPECPIPTLGLDWIPMPPPVVLEEWPQIDIGGFGNFTTIASWRGQYGPVQLRGQTLGLKVHEFRKFVELPRLVDKPFEVALDIDQTDAADRIALEGSGWRIADPRSVAGDPRAFRQYVQTSLAEFSVAKGAYVDTNSGWFSDRTTRYLASGKPALVQETGWSGIYPTGEGLLTFRSLAEAADGAESIARDYARHSAAARDLAESLFDSDKVLSDVADRVGLRP